MATSLNVSYVPITFKTLGGGLNSTSGPLGVSDNESSDLLNVEFNKFGSAMQRNGYTVLNSNILTGTAQGLYWYRGPSTSFALTVNDGKIYKMDALDGVWDNISGAINLGSWYDAYTDLMLHCDGDNEGTSFIDSLVVTKTAINTETYDSYTTLMLHLNSSSVNSATSTSPTAYNVVWDTSTKKFGSASSYFSGNLSYIDVPDSAKFDLSTSNFSIEFMAKFEELGEIQIFAGQYSNTDECWLTYKDDSDKLGMYFVTGGADVGDYTTTSPVILNTTDWYHVMFERVSTTGKIYVNGLSQPITSATDFSTGDVGDIIQNLTIGAIP